MLPTLLPTSCFLLLPALLLVIANGHYPPGPVNQDTCLDHSLSLFLEYFTSPVDLMGFKLSKFDPSSPIPQLSIQVFRHAFGSSSD